MCNKMPLCSLCCYSLFQGQLRSNNNHYFGVEIMLLKEALLQPVLKSFNTDFIQYSEKLENKVTRAPLLGLTKSLY